MFGFENLFVQVAAALTVAVVLGLIATLLKQPLIVAFIATGILVGPEVLGIIEAPNEIALLAKIGISILLFVVGLKLDVREIRMVGPVALATGLGQVVFTSVFGFVIALALGFDVVPALYIAVALTFSSTIIIVKLLSDKRELDHLHGRIAIGFLIVQDIAVVLAMIALTAFDVSEGSNPMSEVVGVLVRGGALVIGLGAVMRWVLPPVVHRMAHSAELLVLFAIAWAVALAAVTDLLGFSEEVGAFLAGMSLASTPYREAIGGRLTSLRDFLLLFFFIDIGTTLEVGLASSQLVAATLLSLFVLIGNPIIVMVIMGLMRYPKRVSFLAGADRGADQRVLPDPRRARAGSRSARRRDGRADHDRRDDHDHGIDLHDPQLRGPVPAAVAAALRVRAPAAGRRSTAAEPRPDPGGRRRRARTLRTGGRRGAARTRLQRRRRRLRPR
jgi:Kef-type K+ transport system membrane component KefB